MMSRPLVAVEILPQGPKTTLLAIPVLEYLLIFAGKLSPPYDHQSDTNAHQKHACPPPRRHLFAEKEFPS